MAVPTGTTQTSAMVGIREDLEDVIYDLSPTETPFLTRAARGKATQTNHEWQTDALKAAGTNTTIEGDDATVDTIIATVRINDYTQISDKVVSVSGTADKVDTAGRKSELSYQIAKRGKELKRDMEYALTRNQASSAGGAGTARALASTESWIATNKTSKGTGTAQTTPGWLSSAVAAPTDSTVTGSMSEANLKAMIAAAWAAGGDPSFILVGPTEKQKISTFAGIATQYRENSGVQQATILGAAAVYVSDFGEHRIVPSRFCRDVTVQLLDMEYWEVAYLRPFQQFPLAKTGDSDKRQMLVEYTLVSRNEAASAKITDVNAAL